MAQPKFLQYHTLHSYPAALLNRDASGMAKRMRYGDAVRTRISSQCLKRHWRDPKDEMKHEYALHRIPNLETAVRTREVVDRRVMQPIRDAGGVNEDVLNAVQQAFHVGVYGDRGASRDARQPLLLGLPEVEFLQKQAKEICNNNAQDAAKARDAARTFFDNNRQNFQTMREQLSVDIPKGRHAGVEGALFGRMVTSDPGANIEAAVHVAHAFTVHREESESDYFTAVDDLQTENDDPGAGFIGDSELTAGLFYGYVVVDVPGLVSNLEGCNSTDWQDADRELTATVIEHLTHLIATVSPGAKLGSTAPYGYADMMLIEAGNRQPRSLANAFREPARPQVADAAKRLSEHLGRIDDAYGAKELRRFCSLEKWEIPGAERLNLDGLAAWVADSIRNGKAE